MPDPLRAETPLAWTGGSLPAGRAAVMGILNVTPDSFFDGGRYAGRERAVARAFALAAEGADILDIGGESTRPGAAAVSESEQIDRVVPVIEEARARGLLLPISVDTTRAAVAAAALDAGAQVVNDVTGGTADPELLEVVADRGAAVVLMHMRGTPRTMQSDTSYGDVVAEVAEALAELCEAAGRAGVPVDRQAVDPGIGFAKTAEGSLRLLANLEPLLALGRPVLIGASRKSFLGRCFGQEGEQRLYGSVTVAALCAARGASILRVHDVGPTRAALDVVRGFEQAARPAAEAP